MLINQLEEIKDTLFKYFETRLDLFKIETRDKIERAVIMAAYAALLLCVALVIIILIVILVGAFLNKWLNSDYLGYLILLGFFVLLLVLWITMRETWVRLIRKIIIRFVQTKEDEEEAKILG